MSPPTNIQLGSEKSSRTGIKSSASSMGQHVDNELEMYNHVERSSMAHPGRDVIRKLLDIFDIVGPQDKHRCLVHTPLWEIVLAFLRRNPVERLPSPVIAVVLHRLFLAMDYLHTECHIAHTDIKADNIMFGIKDDSVFTDFEANELHKPVPRKQVDTEDRTIYMSQELLKVPKQVSSPILCDLGSAIYGNRYQSVFIQPQIYRAPEVILGAPWTFSADIWNVGCMIPESGPPCRDDQYPRPPASQPDCPRGDEKTNSSRVKASSLFSQCLATSGKFLNPDLLTDLVPLEKRETTLERKAERELFLNLMRKMLQWEPEKRSSAKALAEDEWIHSHM
ncbi:uncharacterized protein N7506_006757 [Penicillium brevicompactum]|uniref:uncharacterized protein n=1 Tax=Penicillium brevicompactum TaxID=5074 RepID=UPI0025424D18|nr:uncharacterized protein N7506_006757 [Penicillium brevicompactum]KAJ5332974.1 hypothetical protein N7506_006757 [Penicillium brevicompactum]